MVSDERQELALQAYQRVLDLNTEADELICQIGVRGNMYPRVALLLAEDLERKATELAKAARDIVDALSDG